MDVAISGASGLIGSALSASLRADGHRVLRLARGGVTGGDAIGWDPDAGRIDAPALEGVDAVVHLAGEGIGEKRWTDEQKQRRSATAGCAAPRCSRPRSRAGSASRACSCRARRSATTATAATRCSPSRARPATTSSPRCASRGKRRPQPATEAGVRTVLTRTGIVLDAHGGALAKMLLPFKLGIGGRQGSGKQWMSWITLADEVGAIRHAIDNESVRGPVNVVAPNPVTNAEFAHTLGQVLHRPTVLPTPMLPLKLRFGAELVESLLLGSQRVDAGPARGDRLRVQARRRSTPRCAAIHRRHRA